MKWLLIHLNFNGCCYITKVDVRQSQFYLWMFLHHTSETAIFTWNSMVVTTRHKWDVLTSHSWMDVFTRHNGRCYWPLIKEEPIEVKKEPELSEDSVEAIRDSIEFEDVKPNVKLELNNVKDENILNGE